MPRFLTIFMGGGGSLQLKSQSAKISDNFHWGGSLQLKSQSAKISDNFHGGGGILKLTWYSVWVQSMCYIFYF